jgi:hypothetical protein
MKPASLSSAPTSVDSTRRQLDVGIVIATLALLALVIADLAHGGRPDPAALRAAAHTLDGAWRFHTGDDARWSGVALDDADWQTLDLTAMPGSHDDDVGLPDYVSGWMAQGHPGYHGYAWYRRTVDVPAGSASWNILGPTLVENGYELYWNGRKLGGSGRLGSNLRMVGTRPMRFELPAEAAGSRGVLAIRVYMLPGSSGSADGGGLHSAPILAPSPIGAELHQVQWQRTIAGYIVEVIEPVAMSAVIALALWCAPRGDHRGFLTFAAIALALMAARRLINAMVAWTDLMDLPTYSWLTSVMWVPIVAAWTLAWNRWRMPAWRSVDVSALVLALVGALGAVMHWPSVTSASKVASIALFVLIGARVVRGAGPRVLALVTLASTLAALFGAELLDPLGVPGIWFPFGIGVSRTQYVYAIAVPLVALLVVRTLRTKEYATP